MYIAQSWHVLRYTFYFEGWGGGVPVDVETSVSPLLAHIFTMHKHLRNQHILFTRLGRWDMGIELVGYGDRVCGGMGIGPRG